MKKIFNLLLIIPIYFFSIINVSAKDIAIKFPMDADFIGCSSYTTTCNYSALDKELVNPTLNNYAITQQFYQNTEPIGFGGAGDTLRIRLQLTDYLVKGQKYSLSVVMSAHEFQSLLPGDYFTTMNYFGNGYSAYTNSAISNYLYSDTDFDIAEGTIHLANYVFTATANSNYFNFIVKSTGNDSIQIRIYGYTLTAVDNEVDLSGVATQESLNSVQSTLNVMEDNIEEFNATQEETNEKLDETNKELGDINDNITNSTTDNPSSKFEEFENMLPENGVITQLITLPISLFQNVLSSVNSSCSSYNLGNLMGTDLILPCINISNYIGTTLWNVIDILFSGFFVLSIGKKMIKVFNNFTSMEEGDVLD